MLHQLSGGEPAGCTPEYLSDPLLLAQALRRRLLSEPLGHFGLEALHVHVHWRNGPIRYHTTPAIAAVPGPGGPSGWAEQLDAGRLGGIALRGSVENTRRGIDPQGRLGRVRQQSSRPIDDEAISAPGWG